jgi:hypothetical protein
MRIYSIFDFNLLHILLMFLYFNHILSSYHHKLNNLRTYYCYQSTFTKSLSYYLFQYFLFFILLNLLTLYYDSLHINSHFHHSLYSKSLQSCLIHHLLYTHHSLNILNLYSLIPIIILSFHLPKPLLYFHKHLLFYYQSIFPSSHPTHYLIMSLLYFLFLYPKLLLFNHN